MRKSTAENLIKTMNKNGIKVFKYGNDVGMQGGGLHLKSNKNPTYKYIFMHINELCKHFNVESCQ